MIDAAKIAEALRAQIAKYEYMVQNSVAVTRGEYVNVDPDQCPWIGIYREKVRYDGRTFGKHNRSFDAFLTFKILVQAANLSTGEECEDKLEALTQATLDAIWASPRIGNEVDMLEGEITVEYSYNENMSKTIYFQWSMLTVTFRVATG